MGDEYLIGIFFHINISSFFVLFSVNIEVRSVCMTINITFNILNSVVQHVEYEIHILCLFCYK